MTIYRPPSVDEVPEVAITQWQVWQLENGDRHLVGVVPASGHDGRVTSKIMSFNDGIITTRSGRKYHLVGPPGINPDAEYVWEVWCRYNSVASVEATRATDDYLAKNG